MHTPQKKAQILWWFIETKSIVQAQRNCRRIYQKDPPSKSSILRWKKNFLETGIIADKKRSGRPCTSDFDVERVRRTFSDNPRRSVRSAARELDMPISTVYKVIKKQLRLHAYKVQIVQGLEPDDRPRRMAFETDMVRRIEDDAEFLKLIMFFNEASFPVSGIVNRHNVRIWGSENPREYCEIQRDSPKVNVWCGLMHNKVIGPFLFTEKTVLSVVYLDILENFVFP
ncbi:protein GVQW3-like [Parasteatoda tepidariorum]|uniref:protein GVQW3-like n=1 Tax=Parasteatoda tepidariorum TaxID=114398 RepID=UPI0039BD8DEF